MKIILIVPLPPSGSKLLVCGGPFLRECHVLDLSTNTWSLAGTMPKARRSPEYSYSPNGVGLMMTGGTGEGSEYYKQSNLVYSTIDGTSFRVHRNMPMGLGGQCQVRTAQKKSFRSLVR